MKPLSLVVFQKTWFGVGFADERLFGPFPTHDALYEFRKRLGQEGFEQILTLAVQACLEANLVKNELVHFDLTPSEASAHRWSPYERAVLVTRTLVRYLELSWASQLPNDPFPTVWKKLAAEVAIETLPHKSLNYVAPERVVASLSDWEQKHLGSPPWKKNTDELAQQLFESEPLVEIKLLTPETCKDTEPTAAHSSTSAQEVMPSQQVLPHSCGESDYQTQNDEETEIESANLSSVSQQELAEVSEQRLLHSQLAKIAKQVVKNLSHTRGDSDARVGRTTNYTWFCGYLMGFMVDNEHQVITSVVLGAGNTAQPNFFEPAIEAHMIRVGQPKEVALDSAFDQYPIHAYLDGRKITGHVTSRKHSKPRDGGYGTDRVTWHPDEAHPRCAANKRLRLVSIRQDGNIYEGVDCPSCDLYKLCYPNGQGKLKKYRLKPDEHRRWQENRTHNQTQEYKQAQRKRFVSEGRFGLAKTTHRGSRLPYRSENMNRLAALIIASVMNWRILARLAVVALCLFSFLLEF